MDGRTLAYAPAFVILGRELHFGRTARALRVTQSAVSRQTRQIAGGHAGLVRIGYTRVSMVCAGGPAVRALRQEHPEVALDMQELGTNAQVKALLEGRIDIGLLHPPVPHEELEVAILGREPIVLAASLTHRHATDRALPLAVLADDPAILYPREVGPVLYDAIVGACRAAGFALHVVQQCTSWETAIDLAANGLGVAWVPKALVDRRVGEVVALDVADSLPMLDCAVVLRKRERGVAVRATAERVKQQVRAAAR